MISLSKDIWPKISNCQLSRKGQERQSNHIWWVGKGRGKPLVVLNPEQLAGQKQLGTAAARQLRHSRADHRDLGLQAAAEDQHSLKIFILTQKVFSSLRPPTPWQTVSSVWSWSSWLSKRSLTMQRTPWAKKSTKLSLMRSWKRFTGFTSRWNFFGCFGHENEKRQMLKWSFRQLWAMWTLKSQECWTWSEFHFQWFWFARSSRTFYKPLETTSRF